jgi:hypothetical protein
MAAEYPTKLLNHNLTNYSEIVVPSFLLLQHSIYFFFLWSILLKVRLKSLMWDYWAQVQKHRAFIKRLFSFCCCCCFEPVAQANLKLLGPTDLPALASWVAGTTGTYHIWLALNTECQIALPNWWHQLQHLLSSQLLPQRTLTASLLSSAPYRTARASSFSCVPFWSNHRDRAQGPQWIVEGK